MNPLKLLVSVIHNTESIQKKMGAELSREREMSENYKKKSFEMMRVLHGKEMQIEKIQRINVESQISMFIYVCVLMSAINTLYMILVVVDKALQPEEVLLEAKDEHKGEKVKLVQEGEFYDYMYIL